MRISSWTRHKRGRCTPKATAPGQHGRAARDEGYTMCDPAGAVQCWAQGTEGPLSPALGSGRARTLGDILARARAHSALRRGVAVRPPDSAGHFPATGMTLGAD